jgi:hypothetical protein
MTELITTRTSEEAIAWLAVQIRESNDLKERFEQGAKEAEYLDHELEIARHTEDGFVSALEYVKRYLEGNLN